MLYYLVSYIYNKLNKIPNIDIIGTGFNKKIKEKLEKISLSLKIKKE